MKYAPLTREELASVIEGRGAAERVPVLLHFWVDVDDFGERAGEVREILSRYPEDAQYISANLPGVWDAPGDDPSYRWVRADKPEGADAAGIDARVAIADWADMDAVLAEFPDASYPRLFGETPESDGRYRLARWWYCLFERHWQLRGMTNALMDYYTNPDEVHRLFRAVTDFYKVVMERAKAETGADGVFTSDDLGTQAAPFFSPRIFADFYAPYYRELIDKAHSLGMHFWLHACGNIEPFLPEFIGLGLDVIHPIQKHTMDEAEIAHKYGADICVWAGFDVQQTIPWGTPEDVRRELRYLVDTYARPEGRFMLTAGNAVKGDCPTASLEALFDEAFTYGAAGGWD